MRFTDKGVKAIPLPESGRKYYWDSTMPKFGLRVSSTGAKTWITMYWHQGRKRRHTLGSYPDMTLADARERARQSLNEAANGYDPAGEKAAERVADTFAELAAIYLEKHAKKKKDQGREDERILNKDLLPKWKNIKAKDIRRRDVRAVLDSVIDRGAPIHANRVLALVRKVFNFGISRDIVEFNPCTAISIPTKPKSRDRILTPEEIRKVWASIEQDEVRISVLFKLRLITAQRGGELVTMAWDDIDFESAIWTIPAEKAKNGLAHRVPLSPFALKVLAPLIERRNDPQWASRWVFPNWGPYKERKDRSRPADEHISNIQKATQRIRLREGCEVDFVGHDLRRTAASYMASMGISRLVISKILNHVESGITAVYDRHSYDREKREALEAWGTRIDDILEKRIPRGLCTEVLSTISVVQAVG